MTAADDILHRVAVRTIRLCCRGNRVDTEAVERLLSSGISRAEREAIDAAGQDRLETALIAELRRRWGRPEQWRGLASGAKPKKAEEALYDWYRADLDKDGRLSSLARLLVDFLCLLASGEDSAPLTYTLMELCHKVGWPIEHLWSAAACAELAGYIKRDGAAVVLLDPRERPAIPPVAS